MKLLKLILCAVAGSFIFIITVMFAVCGAFDADDGEMLALWDE